MGKVGESSAVVWGSAADRGGLLEKLLGGHAKGLYAERHASERLQASLLQLGEREEHVFIVYSYCQ